MKKLKTLTPLVIVLLFSTNACYKKVVIRPNSPSGEIVDTSAASAPNTNGNGHSIGNGGGFLMQEFLYYGRKTVEMVRTQNDDKSTDNDISEVDHNKLFKAVTETNLSVTNEAFDDNLGNSADARLITVAGVNTIELFQPAWSDRLTYTDQMFKLVFHEYLRVLALDDPSLNDDDYEISSKLDLKTLEPQPHLFATLSEAFTQSKKADPRRLQGFYSGWCIDSENEFEDRQSILALYHYNIGKQQLVSIPRSSTGYMMAELLAEDNMSRGTFETFSELERRDYALNYPHAPHWAFYMSEQLSFDIPNGARRDVFQIRLSEDDKTIIGSYIDLADPSSPKDRALFEFDEEGNEIIPANHIYMVCYYTID